ncbi:MAG: hypothetical protein JWO17_1017 [Actinomycetia bacterium]|nr:hypothetical protein [Actinomycetes bacterium]
MRRIPTMIASAGAAALTTLAVVAAVPAIGDDGAAPQTADALAACLRAHGLDGAPDGAALKPWLGRRPEGDATTERALDACDPQVSKDEASEVSKANAGPSEQELRSCLKNHGIEVPGDDPMSLKRWIGEHHEQAATASALEACDVGFADKSAAVARGKDGPVCEAGPANPTDRKATPEAPAANGGVSAGT